MNLATSLYFGAESEYIIAAQTFSLLQIAKCSLELTIAIQLTYFIWSYYAFQSNLESAEAVQTLNPSGVVIFTFKLCRDFCSYDFAET